MTTLPLSSLRLPLAAAVLASLAACAKAPPVAVPALRAPALVRAADAPPAADVDLPEAPAALLGLPRTTFTGKGRAGDPINLVIAGSERQILAGFNDAGWLPADPITLRASLKMVWAGATRRSYPTSPMSPLHLFDREQDFSFQKNARSVYARDHLRVWRSELEDPQGRPYWAIAATEDVAVYWNKTRPTHRIHPEVDRERALVVADWLGTGQVAARSAYRGFPDGYRATNGEGDPYVTDGRVIVLDLVPDPVPEQPAPVATASAR